MTKMVVWSDLHADKQTLGVSRYDECERAALQVIRYAIKHDVNVVTFAGDLSDPDETGGTLKASALAVRVALVLASECIHSLWIAGNHDVCQDGSGVTTLTPVLAIAEAGNPYVHVAEEPRVFVPFEQPILCLPYTAPSRTYDPCATAEGLGVFNNTIVVAHLMVPGVAPGEETLEMPRGRDVVFPFKETASARMRINGHYHKQQSFDPGDGGPPIWIPGSACRFTHGEERNNPGFLLFDL